MNTEPPILPCLQQLNRDKYPKNSTNNIIDGWDCWFNQLDLDELAKHWPHLNQNKQTVGQLWVGFLRYYTEKFDWEQHVVCIRKSDAPLSRKDKNWNKHRLAIEDPFELSHNLAAGVSHKMGLYILKCFARARSLFGKVIDDFRPEEIRLNVSYFFNPLSLVEGNPPMDRNCYSCFKIGHQTRNCPLTNAKRRDKQVS
jgi:terminal uridylyltransferase